MFAIQSDGKFLNARFFIDPNRVFELTVSNTPKTYKTRSEVDRVKTLICEYVDGRINRIQKNIVSERAEVDRAEKNVVRLEARLDKLVEQPYKTVVKKIPQVKRQLEQAQQRVKDNSVNSYKKDLRRLEQIRASGAAVVKMQQTAVAV
jgi:hypothetical protein